MKKVIVDLDMTLFDISHRLKYYNTDWDMYHSEVRNDKVNDELLEFIKSIGGIYELIILTGRFNKKDRYLTEQALLKLGLGHVELLMKPDEDTRSSYYFKTEWIEKNKDSIFLVIDDRDDILDKCKDLNLNTFKPRIKL